MDTAASGAVQHLKGLAPVTALLGSFSLSDPNPANAGQPWVFHVGQIGEVLVVMEGTGSASLALCSTGGFQAGTAGSSAQYEKVSVEFWVDVTRDGSRNATESSGGTLRRAQEIYYQVDSYLHRIEPGALQVWGDVVTVGSVRMVAPDFYLVPDGDGLVRGQAYYGVTISGHV